MLVNEMIPSLGVKTKCSEVSANNGPWRHLGYVMRLRYEKPLQTMVNMACYHGLSLN